MDLIHLYHIRLACQGQYNAFFSLRYCGCLRDFWNFNNHVRTFIYVFVSKLPYKYAIMHPSTLFPISCQLQDLRNTWMELSLPHRNASLHNQSLDVGWSFGQLAILCTREHFQIYLIVLQIKGILYDTNRPLCLMVYFS